MPRLVAIDMPAGPEFVDAVRRVLGDGDAFLPLDGRLDLADRRRQATDLGAAVVVTSDGLTSLDAGRPTEVGDAVVIATSGSTGTPKGVVLTLESVMSSARSGSSVLPADAPVHWLACLPLSHVGGLSVVFKALFGGHALTVHPNFDRDRVVAAAASGCTHVSLVPTTLRRIDPFVFRCVLLGGSRPPADRPSHVVATYGLSETGGGVVYDGVPLPGVDVEIADDGEILVRSPMNMRCYRDGSTTIDSLGRLHTGDIGRMVDGRLHVDGRLDDLIKTGGEKVWPDVVERAIATRYPDSAVCVAGIDDPEWGQMVVAATTDPDLTLDLIRGVVKESLPSHCAPKRLVLVERLPATSIGKVRRGEVAHLVRSSTDDL